MSQALMFDQLLVMAKERGIQFCALVRYCPRIWIHCLSGKWFELSSLVERGG